MLPQNPRAFQCAYCIQPSGKSWPQCGRQHSASRSESAMRVWGNPRSQGRTCFLTKPWRAGLVRADSPLQVLRRRRREPAGVSAARAKAAKPPLAIGGHLPVESSARKLLLVTLPPPHFDVGGENQTNARMQIRHYSFCIWNSRIVRSACFVFDFILSYTILFLVTRLCDFILVDKIVRRNVLKGLSLWGAGD